MQRIVLYARARAPDYLGTQAWQAELAAKLFSGQQSAPALPSPEAFRPLSAAFRVLVSVSTSPVVAPLDPYSLTLLP